jgi:hypothetical protein
MMRHMQTCRPLTDSPMVAVTLGSDPLQMAIDMHLFWKVDAQDLAKDDALDEEASDETTSDSEDDSTQFSS